MRNPCSYDRDPSSSPEGSTTRAPRRAVLTRPIAAACFALALSACAEDAPDATGLDRNVGVPSATPATGPTDAAVRAIVSDPVQPSGAGAASSPARPSSGSGDAIVYVSLPPASLPEGTEVVVSNFTGSFEAAISIVDGGFDPFPVPAAVGDTLDFEVLRGLTPITDWREIVPASRPPTVVRTSPPRGKRDVPVALSVLVMFSEPIDDASMTATSVQVLLDGVPVAGAVGFADEAHLAATFTPAAPLAPDVEYTLRVTQDIKDLTGDALQAAVSLTFATEAAAPEPEADPEPETDPGLPSDLIGQLAFERDGQIYVVNPDGTGLVRVSNGPGDGEPAWSPDGQRIAFTSDRTGRSNLYILDTQGAVRRTTSSRPVSSPSWSPDGARIAFSTWGAGQQEIRTIAVADDGAGSTVVVLRQGRNETPAWSPDGDAMLFVSDWTAFDFAYDIYVTRFDASSIIPLTNGFPSPDLTRYQHPAWSPDGSMIAFVYGSWPWGSGLDHPGRFRVALMSADGAFVRDLAWAGDITWFDNDVPGPGSLTWSADGRGIAYEFIDCDLVTGSGCTNERSVKYVSIDGSEHYTIVENARNPSWRP
jgi:hypothetical protein